MRSTSKPPDPTGAPGPTGAGTLVGMTGPAISTWGLTRSFKGRTAVDGLTLEVEPGEVLALLGPNGAGKTTTVRLLNGVLAPDAGRAGARPRPGRPRATTCGAAPGVLTEHAGLDERLTARENLLAHRAASAGIDDAPARRSARRPAGAVRHGRPRRPPLPGLLDRAAQARRPGPRAAARPRGALPRRADVGPRPRRPRATSSTSSRASPASTAAPSCCAPTSSARPAGSPTAWRCCTAAGCTPSAAPTSSPPSCGRAWTPTSTSAADAPTWARCGRRNRDGCPRGVPCVESQRASGRRPRRRAAAWSGTSSPGDSVGRAAGPHARGRLLRDRGPDRRARRDAAPPPVATRRATPRSSATWRARTSAGDAMRRRHAQGPHRGAPVEGRRASRCCSCRRCCWSCCRSVVIAGRGIAAAVDIGSILQLDCPATSPTPILALPPRSSSSCWSTATCWRRCSSSSR